MQLDKTNFKNEPKKLKRYHEEQATLEKILVLIKESTSFDSLEANPLSIMYGFEPLKYELSGFYSFNLCKNGGCIRLILLVNTEEKIVSLEYITMNHYIDFKEELKINKKRRRKI